MPFVNAITDPEPTPFLLPLLQNWIVLKIYPPEGKYSFVVHEPRCKPSRTIKHSDIKISNHIPVLPESRQLKRNSSVACVQTVDGSTARICHWPRATFISQSRKKHCEIHISYYCATYKSFYDDFPFASKFRCDERKCFLHKCLCIQYDIHIPWRFILLQRMVFCMSRYFFGWVVNLLHTVLLISSLMEEKKLFVQESASSNNI